MPATPDLDRDVEQPRVVARRLRRRARRLRDDAQAKLEPLADALRRRAAELELQAAILDGRLRPIPVETRVPVRHHGRR